MSLILRKLKQEVGIVGIIRLITSFLYLGVHNLYLRTYSRGKGVLKEDLKKLKARHKIEGREVFNFFPHSDNKVHKGSLDWAVNAAPRNAFYNTLKDVLSLIGSTSAATEEQVKLAKELLPNDKEDSYYRSHALNKGKNDQWEYYLVPWHRLVPSFSFLLWDERFTDHLLPIFKKYKKWYNEFIWFTAVGTGSNIYASEAGKAFHCLNEFVIEGDEKALDRYVNHVLKVKYFMKSAFDGGIPMEGGIYARFLLDGIILLDQVHRALGFDFKLIDDGLVEKFADYLDTAFTRGKGFETSGDSHWELEKLEDYRVFIYMSMISKYPIFLEILTHYPPKPYHFTYFFKTDYDS